MINESIISSVFSSFLCKIGILLIAYFTPIKEIIHVMFFFLAIDTISGVWASVKSGNKVESRKLRKTVYKFIWYTVAVIASFMMETTFHLSWTNFASIVGGFICFVELKSIFENVTVITGDPIFKNIIKILKKKSSETIDEISDEPNANQNEKPQN